MQTWTVIVTGIRSEDTCDTLYRKLATPEAIAADVTVFRDVETTCDACNSPVIPGGRYITCTGCLTDHCTDCGLPHCCRYEQHLWKENTAP